MQILIAGAGVIGSVLAGWFQAAGQQVTLLARGQRLIDLQTHGLLLENTAGQGSNLGHRFEHLARILALVSDPNRLGVCFDTCHAFAAGHLPRAQLLAVYMCPYDSPTRIMWCLWPTALVQHYEKLRCTPSMLGQLPLYREYHPE